MSAGKHERGQAGDAAAVAVALAAPTIGGVVMAAAALAASITSPAVALAAVARSLWGRQRQ